MDISTLTFETLSSNIQNNYEVKWFIARNSSVEIFHIYLHISIVTNLST